MLRKLVRDGSLYTITSFLSRGISLFLLPFYVRYLTKEEYGLFDFILLLVNFVNLTFSLELTQAIARFLPAFRLLRAKVGLISTALWILIGTYLVFFVVYVLFSTAIIEYVYQTEIAISLYYLTGVYMVLNGLFLFLQNNLRWDLQSKKFAVNSLIFTFLNVAGLVVFLFNLNLGIYGVLYANILASVVAIITSYFSIRKYYELFFSFKYAKKLLYFSYPLIFSSVSVYFSLYIDRLIINKYLGLEELAIFGVSYRFASLVGLITVGLSSALTPLIYKDPYALETKNAIARLFYFFLLGTFLFIFSISLFSTEILLVFTTPEYLAAANIMPLITASVVFSSMYIFFPGLSIEGKTKYLAVINTVTAIFNLVLCLLVIEQFGIFGVVLATLATSVLSFVLNAFYGNKYYKQGFAWHVILPIAGLAALSFLGSWYLNQTYSAVDFEWEAFWVKTSLLIVIALIAYKVVFRKIKQLQMHVLSR